jgi:hypothetical protein
MQQIETSSARDAMRGDCWYTRDCDCRAWTDADANESQKQYEKTLKLEEELKEYFTGTILYYFCFCLVSCQLCCSVSCTHPHVGLCLEEVFVSSACSC